MHFLEFFQLKTGIEWKDRVINEGTTDPSLFQYACPVGWMEVVVVLVGANRTDWWEAC